MRRLLLSRAHYADADETVAKSLEQYGRTLGIAFQISDDLLDILGSEDQTGKSLGTDFKKQKLTLPIIRLLAQTEEPDAQRLRELLTQADDDAWGEVVRWLHRSDAVEYARHRALEFAAAARSHLECLNNSSAKQMLVEITEFATQAAATNSSPSPIPMGERCVFLRVKWLRLQGSSACCF